MHHEGVYVLFFSLKVIIRGRYIETSGFFCHQALINHYPAHQYHYPAPMPTMGDYGPREVMGDYDTMVLDQNQPSPPQRHVPTHPHSTATATLAATRSHSCCCITYSRRGTSPTAPSVAARRPSPPTTSPHSWTAPSPTQRRWTSPSWAAASSVSSHTQLRWIPQLSCFQGGDVIEGATVRGSSRS